MSVVLDVSVVKSPVVVEFDPRLVLEYPVAVVPVQDVPVVHELSVYPDVVPNVLVPVVVVESSSEKLMVS